MIPADRQRNFLQSVLYVIIAGVLAVILLERLLTYAEATEKAAMEATLSRLNAGIYARLAFHVLRGDQEAIEALSGKSPFEAADARGENYLGEFDGIPEGARSGSWLFDRARGELVYLPNLKRHLSVPGVAQPETALRFRVEVLKPSPGVYAGISFRPAQPYRWEPVP